MDGEAGSEVGRALGSTLMAVTLTWIKTPVQSSARFVQKRFLVVGWPVVCLTLDGSAHRDPDSVIRTAFFQCLLFGAPFFSLLLRL